MSIYGYAAHMTSHLIYLATLRHVTSSPTQFVKIKKRHAHLH